MVRRLPVEDRSYVMIRIWGLTCRRYGIEIQLSTPAHSVYGVSFPGAPSVVIGFNDSIAWGFTNAMRDVKDYYKIEFQDDRHLTYMFNNEWKQADVKIEEYSLKGGASFYDTVALYSVWPGAI